MASLEPDGRVWVSAEVREEIQEILLMLERSGARFTEVLIDAPESVLARLGALPERVAGGKVRAVPYRHSTRIGVAAKLLGLAQFAIRLARRRPRLLFSGFSMMKHRVVSGVLRVPHIAYIRGVVFDPTVSVGISDRIRFGRLARLVPSRVTASYRADAVLTVGGMNRDFLAARGVPAEDIHVTGPVWLDALQAAAAGPGTAPAKQATAYFLTVAWQAHGRQSEHEAQLRVTRTLATRWADPSRRLVLRVHPRDLYDYEADPDYAAVALDRGSPEQFLAQLGADDLVIAPLSTLAFEAAHLGRPVVFYADPVATAPYNHIYERLGIQPRTVDQLVAGQLSPQPAPLASIFSAIDFGSVQKALCSLGVPTAASVEAVPHRMGR